MNGTTLGIPKVMVYLNALFCILDDHLQVLFSIILIQKLLTKLSVNIGLSQT